MKHKIFSALLVALVAVLSCSEDNVNKPIIEVPLSDDPLDEYIQENFVDKYGVAVRYKYVDRYLEPNRRVTPPKKELVRPMLDFLNDFWIEPFVDVPNGRRFFEDHVPAEVIFIGSAIYENDGTIVLGTADAGARITLTQVNEVDVSDRAWVLQQLRTIYHEFAHIIHQRYNLPPNFQQISPEGYTSSGSWYNVGLEKALQDGFVSDYATSTFNEDYAETSAAIVFDPDFYEKYIEDETGCTSAACEARNAGRAKIRRKYNALLQHYEQYTGVDLLKVREIVQAKLP